MNNHLQYGFFDAPTEKKITVLIARRLSRMLADGLSPLDAARALAILCGNRDYSRAFENISALLQTGAFCAAKASPRRMRPVSASFFVESFCAA